jgi:hypothetical protein
MAYKPKNWKYEPTAQEIAAGCRRAQSQWTESEWYRRKVFHPSNDPWTAPVILDITDARGEYVVILQETG